MKARTFWLLGFAVALFSLLVDDFRSRATQEMNCAKLFSPPWSEYTVLGTQS